MYVCNGYVLIAITRRHWESACEVREPVGGDW